MTYTTITNKIVEKSKPYECVICGIPTRARCPVCVRYVCNTCTLRDYQRRCPGCMPVPYGERYE